MPFPANAQKSKRTVGWADERKADSEEFADLEPLEVEICRRISNGPGGFTGFAKLTSFPESSGVSRSRADTNASDLSYSITTAKNFESETLSPRRPLSKILEEDELSMKSDHVLWSFQNLRKIDQQLTEPGSGFRVDILNLWSENRPVFLGAFLFIILIVLQCLLGKYLGFDVHKDRRRDGNPNTPTQWLNPEDRMLVYVLIGTMIAVASGLGAEIFFGLPLVEKINDNTLWMWMYSQLAFALLVMVAIGSPDMLSLPFGILGLYKFGYPETVSTLYEAWHLLKEGISSELIIAFCDGFGLLMHHSCVVFIMVSRHMAYAKLDDLGYAIIIPPILQHAIVVLRFVQPNVFIVLTLIVEVWWEWEVIETVPYLHQESLRSAARIMLLSHWLYLIAGTVRLFCPSEMLPDAMTPSTLTRTMTMMTSGPHSTTMRRYASHRMLEVLSLRSHDMQFE